MRKCRFCEAPIDDAATVCVHCGRGLIPWRETVSAPIKRAPPPGESAIAIARVSVVNVDMPFASMVGFMVKWALAAIPAILILALLGLCLGIAFGGLARAFGL
jgi:hypothetical protein